MAKKTASVRIRRPSIFRAVSITSDEKPEIIEVITEKWQKIISLIARILDVPAALIMQIDDKKIKVYLKSKNAENPYQEGSTDELGKGLYCETVIGTNRELLVANALEDEVWDKNPDIKLGMISYLGLPIQWPDAEIFGTICVLDCKHNPYNETYQELITEFKLSIEKDLELLMKQEMLKSLADRDILTSLLNRRRVSEVLQSEYERSVRYKTPLTIALIDLDELKKINDHHGHDIGDVALLGFSEVLSSRIRTTDIFGRWGGDEFLLICPGTDRDGLIFLLKDIGEQVDVKIGDKNITVSFSCGIAEWEEVDRDVMELFKRADKELYKEKTLKGGRGADPNNPSHPKPSRSS